MSKHTSTKTTAASNQDKGGLLNVLMRRPNANCSGKSQAPEREIICKNQTISKSEKEALIRLYEALVPGNKSSTINIDLIMEEALPAFEKILGTANYKKFKKYFGIGCRQSKIGIKVNEIDQMLEQVRTIENAQYYIDGYKLLIERVGSKLRNAPEDMTMLEKAKFVRMYHTIFVGFYFFAQDFARTYKGKEEGYGLDVNFQLAIKNNNLQCRPEALFSTTRIFIDNFPEESLIYDLVCFEFARLDKRVQKEVLNFAELRLDENGRFVSVNIAPKYQNFSSIRAIKQRVHPEMGFYPMEFFSYTNAIEKIKFEEFYHIYKFLKRVPFDQFKVSTKQESFIEGSREVKRDRVYYEFSPDYYISGQTEIDRIIRTMEYLAANDFELETGAGKKCNMGIYLAVFNFMYNMKYVDISIDTEREFELAEVLIEMDTTDAIKEYRNGQLTEEQLKERLGIDMHFEYEIFGIEKLVTPIEIAENFAIDNGYVDDPSEISIELLENVVVLGNEEALIKFEKGEIDEETFKRMIGFQESFAEMYFNLDKINISAIENQLQDLKRRMASKTEMKRWALLVSLYCYLVEGQVPCGEKRKAPKRNKGLRPDKLKEQIA